MKRIFAVCAYSMASAATTVSLIQRYLGPEFIHEYDEAAGLHLVLKLPNSCDDVAIAATALERGVKVRPLSRYYMQSHAHAERGLLMGFACVNEKYGDGFWRLAPMLT